MTLIIAIKFQKGVVMACDSRATYEGISLMRNEERKFTCLGNEIAIVGAGMAGFERKISEDLRAWFTSTHLPTLRDTISKCEDLVWETYQRYKERFEKEEEGFPTFVLIGHDKIFRIFENGYAEEEEKYTCEGSGLPYGEYILKQRFKDDMTEEEAKELATYVIVQTSRIDPNVGGKVNLVVAKKRQILEVKADEVTRIMTDIRAFDTMSEKRTPEIIEEIVEKRRWVNAKFKEKFGFELFEQNEYAIAGIQKPCETEAEFTNGITTLALLIDGVNVSALDKIVSEHQPGSINALETFLSEKYSKFKKRIITNLREIMTLRSKKMPIHEDDPKLIQVLLRWEYKIPPNWSSLWMKALQKYQESITELGQLL